jgi:hypothetical protein
MSNGIDMVAGVGSMASAIASASVAPTARNTDAAPVPVTNSSAAAEMTVVVHSPRIIGDPTAGFITQYLSSNGEVMSQVPSAVAVAYMRNGLTADGAPKGAPHTGDVTA